ncbi:hypothetical protein [uncultured Polaribacter sp.]|uniref:hypothetical protein n=1 Tax=uncultured Polaribacter sp. TaxID=174711 RepID=UPI002601D492|nr:hypothetical protein [uncultured Polaribacter sp.]
MKNFRKIILLFTVIFVSGIIITVKTVNSSLQKKDTLEKASEIEKDITYLLKAEKTIETV